MYVVAGNVDTKWDTVANKVTMIEIFPVHPKVQINGIDYMD